MRFMNSAALAACSIAMAGGAFAQAAASGASAAASTSAAATLARPAVIYPNDPGCRPAYPAAALHARAQGSTTVRFIVGADGELAAARVVGASGATAEHKLLDDAALAALSRCPFRAGTNEFGKPISADITIIYRWVLDTPPPQAITPR